MNKKQLTGLVIIPTLTEISKGFSDEAVMAVEMIIAHEARRGHYLKQKGGPALGLIGMEPTTHESTWSYGDTIWCNAVDIGIITKEDFNRLKHPPAERLIYDLRYNIFMARQRLFMKPKALPKTPKAMSIYLKNYWNSVNGAAKPSSYFTDWVCWR